ncbi:ABC transporter permease subunit [Streptomyces albidochromogenes]|uniref:ABC transporter permease subunit n=1 Tax=Streptomyces albidochromogenes TaxID=329524 RepID=A0ABW6FK76_9ACTN
MSLTAPILDTGMAPVTRTTALRRAVRYEYRHLAALRSTWILLGVIAALSLVAGLTTPIGLKPGEAPPSWSMVTAFQMDAISMQVPLSALLLLPLATGPIATEFSRGTARTTWLTLASRRTAYAAKVLVGGALGALSALGGIALASVAAAVALTVSGKAQPEWGQTLADLLGFVIFMACWPVIAASVVALVRNRVAAALLLVLWPLLGERLAGLLLGFVPGLGALADWLPFGAGRAAMAASLDTMPESERALMEAFVGTDLSTSVGTAVFIGFTAVLATLGAWSYIKKDAH